jgi:hypothetical protein
MSCCLCLIQANGRHRTSLGDELSHSKREDGQNIVFKEDFSPTPRPQLDAAHSTWVYVSPWAKKL